MNLNKQCLTILICLFITVNASQVTAQRLAGNVTKKAILDLELLKEDFLDAGNSEEKWELHEKRRYRYLWFPCSNELKTYWPKQVPFVLNSFSQQHVIERCFPVLIDQDNLLYRIDLKDLLWREIDLVVGLDEANYPYSVKPNPLIIRGDFLFDRITDETVSDLGPLLLFGGRENIPKTKDQFAKFFGFNLDDQIKHNFGLVEEDSGVSVSKVRLISYYDAPFGYWWETADFKVLTLQNNPIDNLDRSDVEPDGTEIIAGFLKISTTQQKTTAAQLYMLVNSQEKRVKEAPNSLVTDYSNFKGTATIRCSGSCMQCHPGLNIPHRDAIQRLLDDGVEIWGTEERRDDIERFHLSDIGKTLRRNNEDFAAFVFLCNGLDPSVNVTYFKSCINSYQAHVTLDQAARELECLPLDLQRTVAFASQRKIKIGTTLTDLLKNKQGIPRSLWEELYYPTLELLETWRKINSVPVSKDEAD